MLVVQARLRYTQNPCVGFLLVAGWCFQHFVRNPARVNTRSKSLTINVMCWPQTWRRALICHPWRPCWGCGWRERRCAVLPISGHALSRVCRGWGDPSGRVRISGFFETKAGGAVSRWREIQACNDHACEESKSQNFHESLLDLIFLITATDHKAPIY